MRAVGRMLFMAACFVAFSENGEARGRPFGAGVMLGEPTGLSTKVWLQEMCAVDAGVAWSFVDDGSFHLHGDFLLHPLNLLRWVEKAPGKLPFYFGAGGRVRFAHRTHVGIRVPLGAVFTFNNFTDWPVDLFVELVPIVDLYPATDAAFNGGIGGRYYF